MKSLSTRKTHVLSIIGNDMQNKPAACLINYEWRKLQKNKEDPIVAVSSFLFVAIDFQGTKYSSI